MSKIASIKGGTYVQTGPMDTLLVYFSGHGAMDRYGTHRFPFDSKMQENYLA